MHAEALDPATTFAYLATDRDLGVITEFFDAPPGLGQKPDAVYPP